ncbi:MAG: sigma-54 dependent transcriptional regulator, partial [Pyrinomonadaceae bacterium]
MTTRVLFVEDEETLRRLYLEVASEEGYEVSVAANADDAVLILEEEEVEIVVTDVRMPGSMNGIELIPHIKRLHPSAMIIVVTGHSENLDAVRAMNFGANMYLSKPFGEGELEKVLRAAEGMVQFKKGESGSTATRKKNATTNILAVSPVMTRILKQVEVVAEYDVPVLITGETGTGKEMVARAIHEQSGRRSQPFIPINCAAITDTLMESELFGYEKGAFTDAKSRKEGLFEQAESGTLFLDEIGEMRPSLQAKLLRVLGEQKVRRLGGAREFAVNVRVLAATNRDPHEAVRSGAFREDLLHRLNDIIIDLPPLRERREDISLIARYWLEYFCGTNNLPLKNISEEVMRALQSYAWPGNVRQLKKAMIRAALLSGKHETEIRLEHLPSEVSGGIVAPDGGHAEASSSETTPRPSLDQPIPEGGIDLNELMAQQERQWLLKARTQAGGNQKRAAEMLLLPR